MSGKGRRTIQPWGYAAYIQSPEWRAVRQRYMASKLPKECYVCGHKWEPGYHLHHRTYKNLGAEYLRDLVMLCPDHHARTHRLLKNKPKLSLWGGAKLVRKEWLRQHQG